MAKGDAITCPECGEPLRAYDGSTEFSLGRYFAGGAAGATLIGAATGGALGALGASPDAAIVVIGAGSFVVSALISFFIFRLFVRRLVARTLLSSSEPANVA